MKIIKGIILTSAIALCSCSNFKKTSFNQKNDDSVYQSITGDLTDYARNNHAPNNNYSLLVYGLYNGYSHIFSDDHWGKGYGINFDYTPWEYHYSPYLGSAYGDYSNNRLYPPYWSFGSTGVNYNPGLIAGSIPNSFQTIDYSYLPRLSLINAGMPYFLKRPSYLNAVSVRALSIYGSDYYNHSYRESPENRHPVLQPDIWPSNPGGSIGDGGLYGGGNGGRLGIP